MNEILAEVSVSVTELKRKLLSVLKRVLDVPVVVLNHNQPVAYILSPSLFESILEKLEDWEDAQKVIARRGQPTVKVDLDDL